MPCESVLVNKMLWSPVSHCSSVVEEVGGRNDRILALIHDKQMTCLWLANSTVRHSNTNSASTGAEQRLERSSGRGAWREPGWCLAAGGLRLGAPRQPFSRSACIYKLLETDRIAKGTGLNVFLRKDTFKNFPFRDFTTLCPGEWRIGLVGLSIHHISRWTLPLVMSQVGKFKSHLL